MEREFDLAVIGIGGIGSSIAYYAAQKGLKILGLDSNELAHDKGSSHGQSRLTRLAYFEHPDYVPLLKRAHRNWDYLNQVLRKKVFLQKGLVIWGREDSEAIKGVMRSSSEYGIHVDLFENPNEIREDFPLFDVPDGYVGAFEPTAGYLMIDEIVEGTIELARQKGADLHFEEALESWEANESNVILKTHRGEYRSKKVVIAAGAWSPELIRWDELKLTRHRNTLFWIEAPDGLREIQPFAMDIPGGLFYGFPKLDDRGLKVAIHTPGETLEDLESVNREVLESEARDHLKALKQWIPSCGDVVRDSKVCLYTMSEDEHFIVDTHPKSDRIQVLCGFSGHGFKFASALGDVISDWAADRPSGFDLGFLSAGRF